jgi:hypothetical protein
MSMLELLTLSPKITTSLYDLLEIEEEMASLVVKKQLNLFWIKKVINKKCKDPLVLWKLHE